MTGNVPVTGTLTTTSPSDTYAVTEDQYNKGGYRPVADVSERDAIPALRRSEGMLVQVLASMQVWQLGVGLTNSDWFLFNAGGGSSVTLTGDITGSGNSPIATTLATVSVPSTKGTTSKSASVTIDNKGRVLTLTDQNIQIAESQVTNLITDLGLKANTTDIGVTICPLVTGLVPLANLPFGVIAYKGLYNASTNSPAILNGTGTAGDFYIASVIGNAYGPVNVTIVNQVVAYNGSIWQVGAAFGGGIQNITTDSGTLSGASVTLNSTAQIHDSSGRRYQTDLQQSIQNAAVSAGATVPNRYALLSDLGTIVIGTEWLTPEAVSVGYNSLGGGVSYTGADAGKTDGQFQADFPLVPGLVATDQVAYAAIYQASMLMNNGSRQNEVQLGCFGARNYYINKAIAIPKSISKSDPCRFGFVGHGSIITTTSTTQDLFSSLPVDQTEAVNVCAHTLVSFSNMTLSSTGGSIKGSGQAAIKLGGRGVILNDILVGGGFDSCFDLQFCLGAQVNNCSAIGFKSNGYRFRPGTWTGATPTNAAANGAVVNNCRANPIQFTDYGFFFEGGSDTTMNSCIIEGTPPGSLANAPLAGVFYDSLNATTSLGTFQIHGLYHEQYYKDACVHIKGRSGVYLISDMSNQDQGLDATLCRDIVKLESYAGFMYFQLERFGHFTPHYQFNLGGSNCLPIFMECPSTTAAIMNNPAIWSNFVPSLSVLNASIYPP